MLSVHIPNSPMLNVVMLSVILLNASMLNVVSVITLNAPMLNAVMLSVVAPSKGLSLKNTSLMNFQVCPNFQSRDNRYSIQSLSVSPRHSLFLMFVLDEAGRGVRTH